MHFRNDARIVAASRTRFPGVASMSPMSTAGRHRVAMTLVELLTVIVIIGLLIGLSVPALSRVIARSQMTRCTNNQYQIAFALLRYDEQIGTIPGWLNDSAKAPGIACSWTVPLLPFMGRNDVYDMWPQLPNNPTIDTFVCPSNPPRGLAYPVVHYAANAGAGVLADVTSTGTDGGDSAFKNLFKSAAMPVSLDMIADADGTSTTLAFTEKSALRFAPHTWAYTFQGTPSGSPFGAGTAVPAVCGVATPPGPVSPVINAAALRAFAPSSAHAGGVVVSFCDGHTAFLSDKLQPYEYAQLLTRKSRWQGTTNMTNTAAMRPWLLRGGQPYLLDETILRK